ncbi:hypothetical protein [Nocardioides sp.]|uniref:hypothetical protein n=1 Tax=Nocardioides sp. TaxID=35761 RepID=UPI0019A8CD86|nr:hypothetical protein [Nocardioides sp.]MBC7279208.1 hypothetical protein [Nocardioides sp.]
MAVVVEGNDDEPIRSNLGDHAVVVRLGLSAESHSAEVTECGKARIGDFDVIARGECGHQLDVVGLL